MTGPVSVGELLRSFPPGRITGWDPDNPPEVERAFRVAYLIGASRCAERSLNAAADFEKRLHERRGDLYHGELATGADRWFAIALRTVTRLIGPKSSATDEP